MARLPRYYKIIGSTITNEGIELKLKIKWWGYPIIFIKRLINRIK
jgi:hypothetical protein